MFPPPAYPTPLRECSSLANGGARLWLKDDGVTHPVYGGNKVRKLEAVLADAQRKNARRVLTFGAAGSHHVLTTALLAGAQGLATGAILTPQPASEHVADTLRASLAAGVEVYPVRGYAGVPLAFARAYRRGDYVVPPGASNALGALGYVRAVGELKAQLRAADWPEPDLIVVALGSGGTAAGLLAGVMLEGLKSRVVGVAVVGNAFARRQVLALARKAARLARESGLVSQAAWAEAEQRADWQAQFHVERSQLGAGYGQSTVAAARAVECAGRELGLELDTTYTAKAFANVLATLQSATGAARILYWHTLSSASLAPLLADAPARADLDPRWRGLLL